MIVADIWLPRHASAMRRSHPPRERRACRGELVQIDGCEHAWFEERGPTCTLLVYVDDATSRLMELRFAESESTFDYFAATRCYLEPTASRCLLQRPVERLPRRRKDRGRRPGLSQFGRAMSELNIDIICANSPQAKGRVERSNYFAGPAGQGAAAARHLRHDRRAGVPPGVSRRLQSSLRATARNAYDAHRVSTRTSTRS